LVPVPRSTTARIIWFSTCAVAADIEVFHCLARSPPRRGCRDRDLGRAWGSSMMPLLATVRDHRHRERGGTPSPGRSSRTQSGVFGETHALEARVADRRCHVERRGVATTPKPSIPGGNFTQLQPDRAERTLHDCTKPPNTVLPPQVPPPKFLSLLVVSGRSSWLSEGYTVSCRGAGVERDCAVTTLNVDPVHRSAVRGGGWAWPGPGSSARRIGDGFMRGPRAAAGRMGLSTSRRCRRW
jgi:hypothetical protein